MSLSVPEWLFIGLAYVAGATTLAIAAVALTGWEFPVEPPRFVRRFAGGSSRQRGEVRRYLDAIGERYAEDHVVHGTRCSFYLPDRNVALTFDPNAYQDLRNTDTYVVLCEPGMDVRGLGDRLPFETPVVDWGRDTRRTTNQTGSRTASQAADESYRGGVSDAAAGRRPGRVSASFRTLGVSRDASLDEVKAAYREQVKDVHPDRGGSEEAFARLQDAYATAKQHAE